MRCCLTKVKLRENWGTEVPQIRVTKPVLRTESGFMEELRELKSIKTYLTFYTQYQLDCCIENNPLEEYRLTGANYNTGRT